MKHIRKKHYKKSEADLCRVYKRDSKRELWLETKIEDFLVVGSKKAGVDAFYTNLISHYKVKRLGWPKRLSDCGFTTRKTHK